MGNEEKYDASRRRFLSKPVTIIPAVALASTGLGQMPAAVAQSTAATPPPSPPPAVSNYKSVYFQDGEWAFIHAAVDHLIPQDALGPGAIQAGVPEYIDRQMEMPYGYGRLWYMQGPFHPEIMKATPELGYQLNMTPRDIYRSGIKALNAWCSKTHGKVFAELDKAVQLQVLTDLDGGKIAFEDEAVPAKTFFAYLLDNTKEGFFADPIYGGNKDMAGWKLVGFPGVRADYADWVSQHNVKYPYGPVSISGGKA